MLAAALQSYSELMEGNAIYTGTAVISTGSYNFEEHHNTVYSSTTIQILNS